MSRCRDFDISICRNFTLMATIKRFEDLISWQKSRELVKYIYKLTEISKFGKDFGLKNQIERAAVSSMANQAEGFTRGTKIELINYFYIAKGSVAEVQSHLYVARDLEYIDMSEFQKGYQLADETQRLIQSFVDKVKAGAWSGLQYRNVGISKYQKEKDEMKELWRKEGWIFTAEGLMEKEEAEKRGLKPIED